jgi:hypothetical protein
MWQTQSQDAGLSIEVQHKGSTTDELKAELEAKKGHGANGGLPIY